MVFCLFAGLGGLSVASLFLFGGKFRKDAPVLIDGSMGDDQPLFLRKTTVLLSEQKSGSRLRRG